jgi:hypothetical protein
MTINDMHPTELIEHRLRQQTATRNKTTSDLKNDTDNHTFTNSKKDSSHGIAAHANRNRRDDLEIKRMLESDDTSELELMMRDL